MNSTPFMFSDDGWSERHDFGRILHSYEVIYQDIEANPTEVHVKEADYHKLDHDDFVCKPRFFTPPLQYQRNEFVLHTLNSHIRNTGGKIRKLAVLGCGSLSLERYLMTSLGSMGIERVLSVDIDEHEIAKGLKLLNITQHQNEDIICNSNSLPVLFEVYQGDILEYDERLAGSACVCSTEVVEHIPLPDATQFVRSVLLNVHPDLFIISTPNHEYNEVFGLPHGAFRHDDHKFEFSRQQFRNWLFEIISEFTPSYDYTVKYVGNVNGFDRLGGATQFGIICRKRADLMIISPQHSTRAYKKAGETVLKNAFFILEREKIKQAFIHWLQKNKLLRKHLVKCPVGDFWRVNMNDIMRNVELPTQLKSILNKDIMADTLQFLCRGRVISEQYNCESCLSIPYNVTMNELTELMNSS